MTAHRVVHPVRRPAGPERRVLAWGRLPITREAARRVEQEAKRRNLSPSGLMAAIVESWAEARADAPPSRRLTVCRAPGCERAVYARGLCRPHEVQEREGKPLRPVQERVADKVLMGSIACRWAPLIGSRRAPRRWHRAHRSPPPHLAATLTTEGPGVGVAPEAQG